MPLDVIQGSTPPFSPSPGDQWLNTTNGRYYTWLIGPSGNGAWVISSAIGVAGRAPALAPTPMNAPVITNPTPKITSADIPPSTPAVNDLWFDTRSGFLFIWYYDGNTYQWVVTNPGRGSDVPPPATVVPTTINSDPGIVLTPDPLLGIGSIGVDTAWLDNRIASEIPANLPPSGSAGGDLAGTYPNPTIKLSVTLTGNPTTTTPTTADNTTKIPTTAWVKSQGYALNTSIPVTLPPSGPAGGALSGTYPNPGLATPYPTTLPPNGPAGGDLAGTYPNPTIKSGVIPPAPTIPVGKVAYGDPTGALTGDVGFAWDHTNQRLGVGAAAPSAALSVVPQANTPALAMSGYTVTGSNAAGAFSIDGALNTTGNPDIFKINFSDTSSGGGAAFLITRNGVQSIRVSYDGLLACSNGYRFFAPFAVPAPASSWGLFAFNGAGGNLGTYYGAGSPVGIVNTFGRPGSLYYNGAAPGLPYYNSDGATAWDRMVGETATQTLTNKTFAPASISPGSNGQVMTTVSGAAAWAAASGGASITVSDTPPGSPTAGALWWNSVLGTMFIYYNDGNSTQWVPAAPSAQGIIQRNAISGFIHSHPGGTQSLTVGAGQASDSANAVVINGVSFTKTLAAFAAGTGNGGMGTGLTVAASTWYFPFAAIINGAFDIFFDTTPTPTHIPANTTAYRRLRPIKTDGSSNIIAHLGKADLVQWVTQITETASVSPQTLVGVPPGIQTFWQGNVSAVGSNNWALGYFTPGLAGPIYQLSNGSTYGAAATPSVLTNTAQQVTTVQFGTFTSSALATTGFIDDCGRFD